tara:strand:+ start:1143 stop:2822 length:1680 start_codon:yes stop_codon:yes gene_type:complete
LNKQIIYLLFFSTLFSQINISNELDVRYGNSSNDYNYNELILDSKITLFKTNYMIEGIFSFENSNPPEIGLDERGLRKYLIGYYNKNFSMELGDIYQTWGRGLILNQLDYQNLDFDTGANGLGFKYSSSDFLINLIAGDLAISKSITSHANYDPRVPNYFINQFIYGADISHNFPGFNYGLSILSVEEDSRDVHHSLSSFRFEKGYSVGDIYFSFARKDSEKKDFDENIQGSGFYLSNTNFFETWSITTAYRSMKMDINNPNIRHNQSDNFGNALDIQRSPTGYYLHTFRLLSRTSQEVNLNDEIGIEFQITGPLNENNIVSINYLKSSSTKDWYQNWNGDWLSRKNSTFPSSKYSSYPFEETYLEFSGYSQNGDIYYKTGIDFQNKVFNVLTNGPEFQSFELTKSQTFPFLLSFKTNSKWSYDVQFEYQKLKTGFKRTIISDVDGIDNLYSFHSLLSKKEQINKFISFSANYNQDWIFNFSFETTNADESKLNDNTNENFDSSNSWESIGFSYKFDSDDTLQLFYGSVRGGLDCTNGVCRYVQAFENGLRIDYTSNLN